MSEKLKTTEQVLDIIPVSSRTLADWRAKHLIEYVQIGRKCFYRQAEIERVVDKFTVPAIQGGAR